VYYIVAKDYNVILHNTKKRGGIFIMDTFHEKMEELIGDWDLLYVKLSKGSLHGPINALALDILLLDLDSWFIETFSLITSL
jgi:hypothetical protein